MSICFVCFNPFPWCSPERDVIVLYHLTNTFAMVPILRATAAMMLPVLMGSCKTNTAVRIRKTSTARLNHNRDVRYPPEWWIRKYTMVVVNILIGGIAHHICPMVYLLLISSNPTALAAASTAAMRLITADYRPRPASWVTLD